MLIDKEYPATHSMSTAWFIADKDGNVAIFDFDENGPVPCDIPECCADSILKDDFLLPNELGIRNFNFDDNQSDLLIAYLKDAQKFDEYSRGYIVQIDVSQTDEFVRFASKYNYLLACYSRSKGLYLIDPCEALEHVNKMVEKGVVLKAAGIDAWDLSDNYDEENKTIKYVHDSFFEYFPFYLYQQPYWTAHLTERMVTPKYKFKLQQLNPRDQKRVLRLPISFDDFPKLQVAEFLPSGCTGSEYASVGNSDFALLPLSDGTLKYVRIGFPPIAGWRKCYTDEPTILFIGKEQDYDNLFIQYPILGMKSNSIFPYEKSCFDKSDPIRKSSGQYDVFFATRVKMLRKDWWKYFSGFKDYWDQVFDIVNPYVVVIEDEIYEKVAQDLNVKGEKISILGMEYPYYLLSELNERKTEIESLVEQPYRGKKFLLAIDKEDMGKWLKENERDPLD